MVRASPYQCTSSSPYYGCVEIPRWEVWSAQFVFKDDYSEHSENGISWEVSLKDKVEMVAGWTLLISATELAVRHTAHALQHGEIEAISLIAGENVVVFV